MILGLEPADLVWLAGMSLVAGTVRGFSGFGTAMIYLPVAAQFLPPFQAIATVVAMDLLGPLPNLAGAVRAVDRRDLMRLLGGVLLGLPAGWWLLSRADPELFRGVVSAVALAMVAILILGLRYRRALPPRGVVATGVAGGLLGGFAGLPGPPVILCYMAGPHRAAVVRGTMLLYLYGYDLIVVAVFLVSQLVPVEILLLGLALSVPNFLGNLLGGWLFDPDRERVYRVIAYGVIAASALSGLPLPF